MFSKVRSQLKSGLQNQRQAAILLAAIDETIKEQGESLNPIPYFGSLMVVLDQQKDVEPIKSVEKYTTSGDLLTAVTYLLSILFPQ